MPKVQEPAEHSATTHNGLIDIDAADHRSIEPQKVQKEATDGVNDQIHEEDIACS
jgi:hypothetical protein